MWALLLSQSGKLLQSKVVIPILCVVGVIIVLWVAFEAGRNSQKASDVKATINAINQRDKINGEVQNFDSSTLCTKLGGKWLRDHCE